MFFFRILFTDVPKLISLLFWCLIRVSNKPGACASCSMPISAVCCPSNTSPWNRNREQPSDRSILPFFSPAHTSVVASPWPTLLKSHRNVRTNVSIHEAACYQTREGTDGVLRLPVRNLRLPISVLAIELTKPEVGEPLMPLANQQPPLRMVMQYRNCATSACNTFEMQSATFEMKHCLGAHQTYRNTRKRTGIDAMQWHLRVSAVGSSSQE